MSRRTLWIVLSFALLNGLVYTFLVPPWQHYDETAHFEYVWLIAHRPGWPQEGDFDREMRAATLRSMIAHDFFRNMGAPPSPKAEVPWIAPVPQVGNPPLYYFLAALPARFFPPLDVLPQLYAARLVSLGLFLLTIWLAWAATALVVPRGHPLGWMIPAFMAALPSFVDIMTAVNNDVAGIAAFTLFLYAGIRLIRCGWRWRDTGLLVFAAGLCLLAKRTVFFAPALIPVVFVFSWLRGARRRWAWVLAGVVLVGGAVAALRGGDAALWYRRTAQQETTRVQVMDAPLGQSALRLHLEGRNRTTQVLQLLSRDVLPAHAGETLTLGAWVWATAPVEVAVPRLVPVGSRALPPLSGENSVQVDTRPRFYAWTVRLPDAPVSRAWVQFGPAVQAPPEPVDLFVDGAVLAVGDFADGGAPRWAGEDAREGVWGGVQVENLLRNASFERTWVNPRPWMDALWGRVFGYTGQQFASLALYTARDWKGAVWYYVSAGEKLFRSFWALFGWGHVLLLGHHPYRGLLALSLFLLLGALAAMWRLRQRFPWDVGVVGGLAVGISWGLTLMRGAHHVLSAWVNIPVARYAFPVLLPLAGVLALGWWQWAWLAGCWLPRVRRWRGAGYVLFLAGLTLWGWASVYAFYA